MRLPQSIPLISVIIPVKNGAATLETALSGILNQTVADRTEIIVIDSGSTDSTLALVGAYPVRVHQISAEEFNHGSTRNLGVQLAKGEFVVMTVQDAVPVDDRWLEKMLRHFDDPKVAGVCGKQIVPHDTDKNPMQWHRPCTEAVPWKVHFDNPADFVALSGEKKLSLCGWDDVTAMYRRSVLLNIPFRPVMFAEDSIWAHDALSRSYALVFEPTAEVYHYHHQSFNFRFRRMLTINYHDYLFWGSMRHTRSFFRTTGQFTYHLLRNSRLTTNEKKHWITYNHSLLFAEKLAIVCSRIVLAVTGKRGFERLHCFFCKASPMAEAAAIKYGALSGKAGNHEN